MCSVMHMYIDKELFHPGPKQVLSERHKAEFSQTAEPFAIVNSFVEITWNTDRFLFLVLLIYIQELNPVTSLWNQH